MKTRICAALLAAMMLFGACAMAESPMTAPMAGEQSGTMITARGTAQIAVDPDEVSVTANASVVADTVGSAQEDMNAIVAEATQRLLELGVLADDMVTVDYAYYPRYNYDDNTVNGYEANHTLEITCRAVEMLDGVIGTLTDSGFTQIYSVSYDVSTRGELYLQALELAIARAEQKALRMAQAGGMTITGIESIAENSGYSEEYGINVLTDAGIMRSKAEGSGIRSGSVSVNASVTVVYQAQR